MKQKRNNKILTILLIILILFVGIIVWFNIPYSPLKENFKHDIYTLQQNNFLQNDNSIFEEEDFANFPNAIKRYIKHCNYIGSPKTSYLKMVYNDVSFMQSKNGPSLRINYTQYNFAKEPCRMALIDSSMFGVPFEGYDYFSDGKGGMKGVLAKSICLFNQTGQEMDQACLSTFLAECLFIPTTILQDYITFDEISDYQVKATISYNNITASGIFTFNEQYEMISFTTNDRSLVSSDGTSEYVKWSALCKDYKLSDNGIKYPTKFQAVWNFDDGDFVYFDGNISKIQYDCE